MKIFFRKKIIIWCILFPLTFAPALYAQDLDARSPKPAAGNSQQKKADKKKAQQRNKSERAVKKGIKRHQKIQSKNTRKMMKKSRKSSDMWNSNKREPFYKRMFRKKQR